MGNYSFFILLVLAGFALTDALFKSEDLSSVFIRFYKRNGSYEDARLKDVNRFVPQFNPNETIIIFVHGHTEDVETDDVVLITGTFLNYTNVNVMAVDYRNVSKLSYALSVLQCEALGKAIAKALDGMVDAGMNRNKIYIIGHSLGAQVSGYIGRNLKSKIPRITGLDPAGPGYYLLLPHLNLGDAEFVDIIHTDNGVYGLALDTGSADFFPNFGHSPQPGCEIGSIENRTLCNHHRSWRFYIESIKNRDAFISVKCPNDLMYALGSCNSNEKVIMGYGTPTSAKGKFYLHTNSEEPFGLGLEGATSNGMEL